MEVNFTLMKNCSAKDLIENSDFFEGVFEGFQFKFWSLVTYLFITLCVAALVFVSYFERSGQAGHYRTLLNQLLTLNIDQMILFYVFPVHLDLLRVFVGPLPKPVCFFVVFMKNVLQLNMSMIAFCITLTKFLIICVYKSIPVMDDNFISLFLIILVNIISILITVSRKYLPGRPILNEVKFLKTNFMIGL